MRQSGTEEKAALLLTAVDDEDDQIDNESIESPKRIRHDHFPVVAKRPKTYQRHSAAATHPALCFMIIMGAFIFGCFSGVVIMIYRISQDGDSFSWSGSTDLTKVDLSIRTKLTQSITKNNFLNVNHSIESENDSAKKLEQTWLSYSKVFTRVNKLSYDLTLSTYAPLSQWSGIQLLNDKTDQELAKFSLLPGNDYLTFSSLVKSGQVDGNAIFYVNYGRSEDFAYLFKQSEISSEQIKQSLLFMRRRSTMISQTEQIRQAIRYGFSALVLFDDNDAHPQISTTTDRQSFVHEWAKLSTNKERENFLSGISNDDDRSISVLLLSYPDVQNIFSSSPASNHWSPCPTEWHNKTTSLKLGGLLQQSKIRLITFMQEIPTQLPVVLGHVRGKSDPDHFVMIGYQLGRKQQEKVINEMLVAYENQMKNGWQPRRSIIFCAWSGLAYDHYPIRRWILDNARLIEKYLVAYIDLGNGVIGNSTLNLHGSPLFQQIAQRAADFVVSPLVHDHSCHHRQKPSTTHHVHRRHGDEHGHPMEMLQQTEDEHPECEPHKLLDEWIRASNNRIGANRSLSMVQMIDIDSSAAVFQLQHGIPSILIEMTDEQAINNDTFYLKKTAPSFNNDIQPEILAAYTQFLSEVVRQLIDEPLIPFNLTDYAHLISKQSADYLLHYDRVYRSLASTLGDTNEMTKLVNDLTKAIEQVQSSIDETMKNKNEYTLHLHGLNEKLIQFERLFLKDEPISRTNLIDKTNRHVLFGSAFGLSNTVVPFPSLSNLLYDLTDDAKSELRDALKLSWLNLKEHFQLIRKTFNGLDSLLSN